MLNIGEDIRTLSLQKLMQLKQQLDAVLFNLDYCFEFISIFQFKITLIFYIKKKLAGNRTSFELYATA